MAVRCLPRWRQARLQLMGLRRVAAARRPSLPVSRRLPSTLRAAAATAMASSLGKACMRKEPPPVLSLKTISHRYIQLQQLYTLAWTHRAHVLAQFYVLDVRCFLQYFMIYTSGCASFRIYFLNIQGVIRYLHGQKAGKHLENCWVWSFW